jgi:hypothetical protein
MLRQVHPELGEGFVLSSSKDSAQAPADGAICELSCMMEMLGLPARLRTPAPSCKVRRTSQLESVRLQFELLPIMEKDGVIKYGIISRIYE